MHEEITYIAIAYMLYTYCVSLIMVTITRHTCNLFWYLLLHWFLYDSFTLNNNLGLFKRLLCWVCWEKVKSKQTGWNAHKNGAASSEKFSFTQLNDCQISRIRMVNQPVQSFSFRGPLWKAVLWSLIRATLYKHVWNKINKIKSQSYIAGIFWVKLVQLVVLLTTKMYLLLTHRRVCVICLW